MAKNDQFSWAKIPIIPGATLRSAASLGASAALHLRLPSESVTKFYSLSPAGFDSTKKGLPWPESPILGSFGLINFAESHS